MFSKLWRADLNLYAPVGVAQWLPGPVAPGVMDVLYWATIALGLCFTAGWKHRICGPLFSGLLLLLLCYRNSWSVERCVRLYHGLGNSSSSKSSRCKWRRTFDDAFDLSGYAVFPTSQPGGPALAAHLDPRAKYSMGRRLPPEELCEVLRVE